MDYTKGLVSVVMPCWNDGQYIKYCLKAIKKQTYKNLEVLMVDNASSDDSLEKIRSNQENLNISIISNPKNFGFSKAVNQGIRASKGEFFLALNLDVVMTPDYIEKLVAVFNDEEVGSACGKLYRFPEDFEGRKVLDSTGHILLASRSAINRGELEDDTGQYDDQKDVFGVSAAAAMYRREMLDDVKVLGEYFDEDFFALYEDVDLDWRAFSRGWRSKFVPDAIAYHKRRAWNWMYFKVLSNSKRNKFLTALKNDSFINYLIDLPIIFGYELDNILYRHFKDYRLFFLTYLKMILATPKALVKRLFIVTRRKVSRRELREQFQYEKADRQKSKDILTTVLVLIVLSIFIPVKYLLLLIFVVFFMVNPAIYFLRRERENNID